jgi:putative addiction module component (TIGR02574 family)
MANRAIDVLRARAFELPVDERAALAHDLLASLDDPADVDASEAWDREILRRLDQLDDGTAALVDRAELRRRMRNRIESP